MVGRIEMRCTATAEYSVMTANRKLQALQMSSERTTNFYSDYPQLKHFFGAYMADWDYDHANPVAALVSGPRELGSDERRTTIHQIREMLIDLEPYWVDACEEMSVHCTSAAALNEILASAVKEVERVPDHSVLQPPAHQERTKAVLKRRSKWVMPAIALGSIVVVFFVHQVLALSVTVAASSGHANVVELLTSLGVRADFPQEGRTPMQWAIERGDAQTVRVLIARGLPCDATSTMLIAIGDNHPSLVKLMLAQGADANARFPDGKTALMVAREIGNQDIVAMLTKAGAN
jgi:hypothetical protein